MSNFVLAAIIWGDRKKHFVHISVDLNRGNHTFYDGMDSLQLVVFIAMNYSHPLQNLEV